MESRFIQRLFKVLVLREKRIFEAFLLKGQRIKTANFNFVTIEAMVFLLVVIVEDRGELRSTG